jgi:Zn-dependent protease with chaperone function
MKYTPKLPIENINISKNNILLDTLKFSITIIVLILIAYFSLVALSTVIVNNLSYSQEKKLLSFIDFDFASTKENKKLTKIINDLASCIFLKHKISVNVIEQDIENAFALPGGNIIITSKLLKNVNNDNELYFILGHELGHYINKDHLKALGQSIVLMVMSFILPSDIDYISNLSFNISTSSYSQEQELQADEKGLDLMYCALHSVKDATSFFERMNKEESTWKYFLSTHPHPEGRIKNIKELIKKNRYKELLK